MITKGILSNGFTALLAIILATLIWFAAVQEEDPIRTERFEQPIPLQVLPPQNRFALLNPETIPAEVDLLLTAPQSSWQRLSLNKFYARLDLTDYQVGTHTVPVEVSVSDDQITIIEVLPNQITLQLEALHTRVLSSTIRITGEPPRGFAYRLLNQPISVTVKGPEKLVQAIDRVEGQVFLENSRSAVEQTVQLLAKDRLDQTVDNVALEPAQATVTVAVEQKFGYHSVGIKAKILGEPASGYFISGIATDPVEVILRGPDESPNAIETSPVDIKGTTGDIVKRIPLIVPAGFTIEADNTIDPEHNRSVIVTVEIAAVTGGSSIKQAPKIEGVRPEWTARLEPETVEIFLSGPVPLLQNLTQDDVMVIIDLFGLPEGTHRLMPTVITLNDDIKITDVIPETVEVTLLPTSAEPSPTPVITSTIDTINGTLYLTETQVLTP